MSQRILVLAMLSATTVTAAFVIWFTASAPVEHQRERARDFLRGDPNRSVRGGQEMKPQWD